MLEDETAQIEFALSYAIRFKVHWTPRCRPDETRADIMAQAIRRHLELAGVKLRKRPPRDHGSFQMKVK